MIKTREDLEALKAYCVMEKGLPRSLASVRADSSAEREDDWMRSPRQFCSVEHGTMIIACAPATDALPGESRVGILLHEIGHVLYPLGSPLDVEEVEVDVWVRNVFPEAGYTYVDVPYRYGKDYVAKNLQTVAPEFYANLKGTWGHE